MHQAVSLTLVPLVFLAWTRLARAPGLGRGVVASVASAALLLDMERFFTVMPFVLLVFGAVAATREGEARGLRRGGETAVAALGVALGVLLLLCFPIAPVLEERSLLQWHPAELIRLGREQLSFVHALELVDRDRWLGALLAPLPAAATAREGQWYQGLVAMAFVAVGAVLAGRQRVARDLRVRLAATLAGWCAAVVLAFGSHSLLERHRALLGEALAAGPGGSGGDRGVRARARGVGGLAAGAPGGARRALAEPPPDRRCGAGRAPALDGGREPLRAALPRRVRLREDARDGALRLPDAELPAGERRVSRRPRLGPGPRRGAPPGAGGGGRGGGARRRRRPVRLPRRPGLPGEHRGVAAGGVRKPGRARARAGARHLGLQPLADRLAIEARRPNAWGWLSWTSVRPLGELLRVGFAFSLVRGDLETAARVAGVANVRFLTWLSLSGAVIPPADALAPVGSHPLLPIAENRRVLPYAQYYREIAWLAGPLREILPRLASLSQAGIAAYTFDAAAGDARPATPPDYAFGAAARRAAPGAPRPPRRPRPTPSEVAALCALSRTRAAEIRLACDFARAGYLAIAESWSPRWRVAVDGARRPLLRLNHAFQGVVVAPGDRDVVFTYAPSLVTRLSLAVSATAAAVAVAYGLVEIRRRRARARSGSMPHEPEFAE